MIIKSLKLDNIRSYTSQEIKFPTGSTLLCGDIGSGKSSILLAIEFALFGIRRAQLTPASLLRHGKKEGGVELHFEVEGREVIIKRNLKKSADAIKQESGFVIVDGKKIDGTAVELKTIILDLLGYPKELVTKSKSLIYRYTVYTPQEEMKHILFEEKDQRLDTLRKVFGIDKYKRISENAAVYIKHLKEENKELNGRIADLSEKKKTSQEQKEKLAEVENKLRQLLPTINAIKSELESKKKEIEQIEQKVKQLNELKNKYNILETRLREKVELNNKVKNDLKSFEEQTAKLKQKIDSIVVQDFTEKPEQLEKEIVQEQEKISTIIEDRTKLKERANALKTILKQLKAEVEEHTEQIKALNSKKSELEALDNEISKKPQLMKDINSAEEKLKSLHLKLKGLEVKNELSDRTKYNINKLALCPTCRQPVSEDHKKHVCEKEDSRIAENKQSITSLEQDRKNLSQNIENAKKLFDKLAEKEKLGEKLKAEIANLEVLKKKLVEKQKEYSKNDIELINISVKLEKIEGIDFEKLKK
ncbi:SMC family ATPase [Candidatus Woesearchaeota archaeon]|nr:SMC family ATPase [Candidatus Woesearchaeota archaeon]